MMTQPNMTPLDPARTVRRRNLRTGRPEVWQAEVTRVMIPSIRWLVAVVVAAGCTGTAPPPAAASVGKPDPAATPSASGVFRYHDAHRSVRSVTNPAPGACLRTRNSIRAVNDTSRPIEVYGRPDCRELVRTVEPGGDFLGDFHSAMVDPHVDPPTEIGGAGVRGR